MKHVFRATKLGWGHEQEGRIGMHRTAQKYDAGDNTKFSNFE